ncbi:uncharacterized protein [Mytilus edulis]|uniref:uncharacterized protein isoform X1 n=1 Tax=Mytilus edulis TaxID=6550 RepID=UPI0039EF0662
MSGSVTDSDACGTDWENWIPQIDSTNENDFTWIPQWKNFRIKLCSQDKVLENPSGYLDPIKIQFLMTHHFSIVQNVIRSLDISTVDSINSTKELLEIKLKSVEDEDIVTEIESALARETDEIVMKPIQRLKFTSSLVEELFRHELKEKSIALMRDETNIFIVGFEKMKSYICKKIDEIHRVTAKKVVKLDDKWKSEAIKCFGIAETIGRTFNDVVIRLQEDNSSVYLKGRDITINKAEKEVHKLLSELLSETLHFDPLILKLLMFKEASELFKNTLQKKQLQVVWSVDSTHLYLFSKTKINTDTVKAVIYENFLATGFSKTSQNEDNFCNSSIFVDITRKQNKKLLFLETTNSSVNIAGTKSLMLHLLQQEKLFYNGVENENCNEQMIMQVADDNCLLRPYDIPHDRFQVEESSGDSIEIAGATNQPEGATNKPPTYDDIFPVEIMPIPGPTFQQQLKGDQGQQQYGLYPGPGYPYTHPYQPQPYGGHLSQPEVRLDHCFKSPEENLNEKNSPDDVPGPSVQPYPYYPQFYHGYHGYPVHPNYPYPQDDGYQYHTKGGQDPQPHMGPNNPYQHQGHMGMPRPGRGQIPHPPVDQDHNNIKSPGQNIKMIQVSNIPSGTAEDAIRFFFENKRKSGGGEIEDLDYDDDSHSAIITFEEDEVAERVISRMPLLFEKKKIDVEIFQPRPPTPDVEEDAEASGNEETIDMPTEFVIEVRGMKPTTSEDIIRYYFESRKVANADVVKMEFVEEKEMYMIWFEEESAVEAVMSKSLRVDGQTLNAKRYVPSPPPKPVPKYDNKVFITNISSTTTKDSLEIFLEAKSKGMPEEIIFGEAKGTALITFEQQPDMEKLQTACMKRQLDGSHLRIHTVPITDCIVVTGYKDNTSSDRIEYYFDNKRRSGVEGVREVKLVEDEGKLLVYFNDPESALEVCKREHKVEGQILNVHVYYECLGQASIDDEGLKFKSLKQTVIQNINPRTIEFLLNSDKNKAAFEKKLSRHYAVVEWPDSKDIEDKLDVNCTLTEEVKDCRKLAKTWAKTVKTEAEKFFSMLTVKEIQTLQKAWNVVMKHLKEISISNPESVAIRVIKEDCKIVIIGHKIPVEEVAEKVEIIMKDVAAEHDRRKLQVTEEVPLKHFQLLVLLYLHFLDKMKKEFEGLSVHVNMKKHIMIFTGMTSHVNAAKVKMFEQIQEITFVTAGKFSAGYIEFLKIPEVKSYVGQQIKQKGVLGIWNVKEGNVITMYSLSDENAVTACDVLKKSIIEAPISLDDKQSALIGYEVWNEEIKTVQMEYKKALVKIVVADSKTIVIYQTSAEDSAIVKEKVMDIFHRHRYASSRYRGRRN